MAVAQGINKQTVFAKQSALGTPATSGGQIIRRTNSVFGKSVDTYNSAEIVSHQQSTGATAGIQRTSGKLDGELSAGTYAGLFASLLRKDMAATADITGLSITIAGSGPTYTVTRGSGSFLTDGVKDGDVGRLTAGSFDPANLNKNLVVVTTTALVLTVLPLNGVALVAEGPIASATWNTPGKKSWVPTTGHTNDYYTVEEIYSDITRYEQFFDTKIGMADVALPATGISTVSFDVPGLSRGKSGSATITSPSAETTTEILTAVNGKILVNGAATTITGAQVKIEGNIQPGEAEVGSNSISDLIKGRVAVTGSFTAKFSGVTLQDLYDNQTVVTLVLTVADGSDAAAEFLTLVMPAIKVFSDDPDDGETKEIVRSYSFTAQHYGAGGASAASHATIVSVQDSQAA